VTVWGAAVLFTGLCAAAETNAPLPRVLILGDSISCGYAGPAAYRLRGVAQVEHARGNGQGTGLAVQALDSWLGTQRWDVIHFNFGIWDLSHGFGKPSLIRYENNLARIVNRLRQTGAKLIWASTTPVPEDPARFDDVRVYNAAAARLMGFDDVPINDLYHAILPRHAELHPPDDPVHFTAEGYELLGASVAEVIRVALGLATNEPSAAVGDGARRHEETKPDQLPSSAPSASLRETLP
jgi:acyl-CoA thioesterase-1